MARNPEDVFAGLRVKGTVPPNAPPTPPAPAPAPDSQPRDVFAALRIPGTETGPELPSLREENTLGEEFIGGLGSGIDGFQGSLYGVAGLAGRELGIGWMEDVGNENAARNFEEAGRNGRTAGGFSEIESAGGFFKWASASLGEAVPSLAFMATGAGLGATVGKKAIELGVKKSIARSVERRLVAMNIPRDQAMRGARDYMTSKTGQTALARAFTQQRTGKVIGEAASKAIRTGRNTGAYIAGTLPQIGGIDQELQRAGIAEPGLTALLGGVVGGALEVVPALRFLDKMFPGVDRQVSKTFVKDFAVATGQQLAIEGTTEGLQEIITLASLAYHDPTFDMFSPEAKTRVLDAFAAGAVVGAVMGGSGQAIGEGATRLREAPGQIDRAARAAHKVAAPIIGKWTMDAKEKTTQGLAAVLPADFTPADKTVYEEIKSRIGDFINPHIEAAVNSGTDKVDLWAESADEKMDGGLNAESASIGEVAKAARDKFLKDHGPRIQKLIDWNAAQAARIAAAAKAIRNPEERADYIAAQLAELKKQAKPILDKFRRDGAKRDQDTEAEVDNMDFSDEMIEQMVGVQSERERQANQQRVDDLYEPGDQDAQTGEVDVAPVSTFGKFQKQPEIGVNGKNEVVGYDDETQAKKGRQNLRRRFRKVINLSKEGTKLEDFFRIIPNPKGDGTFVIEVISQDVKDAAKFFNDLTAVERSGSRIKGNKNAVSVPIKNPAKFGFRADKKQLHIDVQTAAYKGKNIDPNASTDMEGFLAFAGELLAQGIINKTQFKTLFKKAEEVFETPGERSIDSKESFEARAEAHEALKKTDQNKEGVTPAQEYETEGQATQQMIEFSQEFKAKYPWMQHEAFGKKSQVGFDGFAIKRNKNGTYSYGLNPAVAQDLQGADVDIVMEALNKRRRDEVLDESSRKNREFSGNPEVQGPSRKAKTDVGGQRNLNLRSETIPQAQDSSSGDLGDNTGVTAGAPDVAVGATFGQRRTRDAQGRPTGDQFQESRDTRAQTQDGETAPQLGDQRSFAEETGGFGVRPENNSRQSVAPSLEESAESQQQSDLATDPNNKDNSLRPEFDDRAEELEGTSKRNNSKTSPRAKRTPRGKKGDKTTMEQTERDNNQLTKRWGAKGSVVMMLGDVTTKSAKALAEMANFVTKKLGLTNKIVIMDDAGLRNMIATGKVTDPIFEQTLNDPSVHARNIRIQETSFIYLSPKILSDPSLTVLSFGHELGHQLYRVAWDNMTESGQQKLRDAYEATLPSELASTEADFNEWMADQLAAWIVQPRLPQNAAESFFAKVGGQIRRLYDFIKGNPRFELDETFAEFADAVALKAAGQEGASNPLADAQIKAWFKNEGASMYAWFGEALEGKNGQRTGAKQGSREVDNMAYDFGPVTEQSKKGLARMESKFPAIVKRAVLIKNWVANAWKMAVAPSTSTMLNMAKRGIHVANDLVLIMNRGKHGDARSAQQNYHQQVRFEKAQFMAPLENLLEQLDARIKKANPTKDKKWRAVRRDQAMEAIGKSLTEKDGNPNAVFTKEEQVIRDLFDQMHEYATDAGLPVNFVANYFTRQLSHEKLLAAQTEIIQHIMNEQNISRGKARAIFNSLIDPLANDGRATIDATETPGFKAMNSRKKGEGIAGDTFFDQYLETNAELVVSNYINQVVKRAEFNKRFGEKAPDNFEGQSVQQLVKSGRWDPKGKMHAMLAEADKQGATDEDIVMLEAYIDANLGQYGRDDWLAKPGPRKLMAGVMAYQNMRVLLFTVFASLPDAAGPMIRSGDMRGTFKTLKNHIKEMAQDKSKLAETARAYGIISDAMSDHIMTEYVDNHYMSKGMRNANDAFFKYTGLNWYTDFTRKYALAVGMDYLVNNYDKFVNGTVKEQHRAKDMLAELGMTPNEVKQWMDAGKPSYNSVAHDMKGPERKAAEALIQFVDESIMRPNASQRPILYSHPGFMLVGHLKGYMYAVHDIVLKRLKFNIDEAQNTPEYLAALAPAIAMMLLTAVGLELREIIQYAGSNRKPPTDRMDGWEYTFELMQRSGLTGFGQLGFDLQGAEDRGMSHVAGVGGPTMSQAADVVMRPSTQTVPKAIPIVGQIPFLRKVVRDAMN